MKSLKFYLAKTICHYPLINQAQEQPQQVFKYDTILGKSNKIILLRKTSKTFEMF